MHRPPLLAGIPLADEQSLKSLVENRTAFTLSRCELNVFQTNRMAEKVPLTFGDFVVTGMLRGKKVMHLPDDPGFDYYPGETVMVPAGVTMNIDFPEADADNPTQCIALAIDHQKIDNTLNLLNERFPRQDAGNWQLDKRNLHLQNNIDIAKQLNKLISICTDNRQMKDVFADLALQELIVSIIQAQHLRSAMNPEGHKNNKGPLGFITDYIRKNIHEDLRLEELSKKAYMSRASFYRAFKKEYGISPLEFILHEKIKRGKELLSHSGNTVKNVALECGFADVNYFVRLFRKTENVTPKQYQQLILNNHQNR